MEFTYKQAIELLESFVNDPGGLKISDLDYIISQVSTVDTTVSEDAMYHIDIFRVLMRLFRKQTNAYSCGAGISQLTVSADGKILPCPKYAGLGFDMEISDTVWENSRIAEVVRNEYKAGCQGCWARQLCIGYCYSLKYRNKTNDRNLHGRCWHVREMNRNIAQQIVRFKENNKLPVLVGNIHKFDTVIKKT